MKLPANRSLLLVLLLALVVRLGLLAAASRVPSLHRLANPYDSAGYHDLAIRLLTKWSYLDSAGESTGYRMPGYPLLLAGVYLFWPSTMAVRLLQIGCDLTTIVIVHELAVRLLHSRQAGLLAALIVALNPLIAVTSLMVIPEAPATTLLVASTYLLAGIVTGGRASLASIAGLFVLTSLAVYLKPTLIGVCVFMLVLLVVFELQQRRPRQALAVAAVGFGVMALMLAPWVTRNCLVLDACVVLTTSEGTNLYGGNNPNADGGYTSDLPYILPGMTEVESDSTLKKLAQAWIWENPSDFLRLAGLKAVRHWSPIALGTKGDLPLPRPVTPLLWAVALMFYACVLVGVLRVWQQIGIWAAFALLLVPVALFIPSLVSFGATRFALPGFPQLAVLAVAGLMVTGWISGPDRRSVAN